MKHELRKKNLALDINKCHDIIIKNTSGILSLVDKDNNCYGIPLTHLFINNTLYFHCANEGYKLECLKHNNKLCYTIIDQDNPIYIDEEKDFTTKYRSVMIFGNASIIDNDKEKEEILKLLCLKVLPNHIDNFNEAIKLYLNRTTIIKLDIDYISGKSNIKEDI